MTLLALGGLASWIFTAAAVSPAACEPVASVPGASATESAVFLQIAREEEGAGRSDSALWAYREVLQRAPDDRVARGAFLRLCAPPRGSAHAAVAALYDAGQCRTLLDQAGPIAARVSPPDALLVGMCAFDLGEWASAERWLEQASREPGLADLAHLYLAWVAEARGDQLAQNRWRSLANQSSDPQLRRLAREERGTEENAFSTFVLLEAGHDSNVGLLPAAGVAAAEGAVSDGFAALSGGVTALLPTHASFGASVLFQLRKQVQVTAFDTANMGVLLFWSPVLDRWQPRLTLSESLYALGFAPTVWSHELEVGLRRMLGDGRRASLDVSYVLAYDDYRVAAFEPYEGWRQAGFVGGHWRVFERLDLGGVYRVERRSSEDARVSFLEHGPSASVGVRLASDLTVDARAGLAVRNYDARSETLLESNHQTFIDLALSARWNVSGPWSILGTVSRRSVAADTESYAYDRWIASVGMSHVLPSP